jgi:AcrR family transcriptional regulator
MLTRDAVLAEALAVGDAGGFDAVTIRGVAERLGVTPMALYRHVGDKSQLLDGVVEQLLTELPVPDDALPWPERLRATGAATRETARRHPDVFPLLLQRPAATPAARAMRESLYQSLRDAGVPDAEVPQVERLVSTMVLGFAASEAAGRFTATPEQVDADFRRLEGLVLHLLEDSTR